MAKFCSECGEPLPSPNSKFCGECGAEQFPNDIVSTRIDGNVNGSTIISGKRVNFDRGEAVPCPDCFGTGIEHIECPNCNGSGLTRVDKRTEEEMTKDAEKRLRPFGASMGFANKVLVDKENPDLKDKILGNLAAGYAFLSLFKAMDDLDKEEKIRALNENNFRNVICPVCEGRKYIPINHEENLKSTRLRSIPVCPTCNGYKKVYLPD